MIATEVKTCNRCKLEKSTSDFGRRGAGLNTYCKDCMRQFTKHHYLANKQKYQTANKQWFIEHPQALRDYKLDRKALVIQYLVTHPCVDCGETDPVVLEFDHRDRHTKTGSVNSLAASHSSWERIQKEIDKCDVRCCNCHRRRTTKQFNYYPELYRDLYNGVTKKDTAGSKTQHTN